MRRPLSGSAWTLAALVGISVIAGFCVRAGFSDFGDTPVQGMIRILPFLFILDLLVLIAIVWPQALLASWLVRRFHAARVVPFALFFALAGAVVGVCLDRKVNLALNYVMAFALVFVPCSTLWCISFEHEPTG
jgi:hypothetical protein